MKPRALGFVPQPLIISLDLILPTRKTAEGVQKSRKFEQIQSSVEVVGLIEPLIVGKKDRKTGQYILLDGHVRLVILKKLGFVEATCLVATDDETYTYNKRVNRLSTIQEHFMIRRAIERGVEPARLAKALGVDVMHISRKLRLLDGVCAEAASLLKDFNFSVNLGQVLRRLKPMCQVECVELMVAANKVSIGYAQALLASTPPDLLVGEKRPRKVGRVTSDQMAKMQREMGNLQSQYKLVEQSYGHDVLNLVLAKGYVTKLLANAAVTRFLSQNQPEVLAEFRNIAQTAELTA